VYKNGEYKTIKKIELNDYLKDGWEIRNKCRGRISPTKGKIWIYKDDRRLCINKSLIDSYVNDGWMVGRNVHPIKNFIGICKNGINKYIDPSELDEYLDDGWEKRMTSRNKGMITVYDPNHPEEKSFSVSINDHRYLSGELKMSAFKNYNNGKCGPCKGLKYIHKENQIKRVSPELIQQYLDDGWLMGMK